MNLTPAPVTEYSGFELAIGSVFAVRWFRPDNYGRLHAINHNFIWKPGENVAKCQRSEGGGWYAIPSFTITYGNSGVGHANVVLPETADPEPISEQAVKARVKVEHLTPQDSCGCGFYAFAGGCLDDIYRTDAGVRGVIECYGRTILGTRGLRCEKARIVGLLTGREDIRRAYPDVRFFAPSTRRFRKSGFDQMLDAFDLVQPYTPTPADPDFWERP